MNTQTPKPNVITFGDLMSTAAELGKEAGKGKDTQIKFLLAITDGAYHGAINLEADRHAKDVDDAVRLAETYVKAQTGVTIFDAKAPNQKKTISCMRACIKLGQYPHGGPGEPIGTVNNLMTIRQKLKATTGMSKKLDDAANTLLRYARAQMKRQTLLTVAELNALCLKADKDLATAENIIAGMRNALNKLISGKASHGTAMDDSAEVKTAAEALTKRLAAIAAGRAPKTAAAATAPAQAKV